MKLPAPKKYDMAPPSAEQMRATVATLLKTIDEKDGKLSATQCVPWRMMGVLSAYLPRKEGNRSVFTTKITLS